MIMQRSSKIREMDLDRLWNDSEISSLVNVPHFAREVNKAWLMTHFEVHLGQQYETIGVEAIELDRID